MSWFSNIVISLFSAIHRAVYKPFAPETGPRPLQTTHQPLEVPQVKVIIGDPLTESEWAMIQASPRVMN